MKIAQDESMNNAIHEKCFLFVVQTVVHENIVRVPQAITCEKKNRNCEERFLKGVMFTSQSKEFSLIFFQFPCEIKRGHSFKVKKKCRVSLECTY